MKKLVIVDNDTTVAGLYRNKFRESGYHVEIARDGKLGLAMILRDKPDAVLMELLLPELSGEELIGQLRSNPEFAQLPIVIATHGYSAAMLEKAWDAGANEVLTKAVHTAPQIVEAVRKAIENRNIATTAQGVRTQSKAKSVPVDVTTRLDSPTPSLTAEAVQEIDEEASEAQFPDRSALSVRALSGGRTDTSRFQQKTSLVQRTPQDMESEGDSGGTEDHAAVQAELLQAFSRRAPALVADLRATLARFIECPPGQVRLSYLLELSGKARAFGGSCSMAGLPNLHHSVGILDRLAKELFQKPTMITNVATHTLAQGIDLIAWQLETTGNPALETIGSAMTLVVEDDEVSWQAICSSLARASFHPVVVCDDFTAKRFLAKNAVSLVVLDLDAAHVNAIELCEQMRLSETNKLTPAIFLATSIELETKAKITLCAPSDVVMKPFLFNELAMKAALLFQKQRTAKFNGAH